MTPAPSFYKLETPHEVTSLVVTQLYVINFFHDSVGFDKSDDYFLIVLNVLVRERAALAVFEPFLRGLIAADVGVPGYFRHAPKILLGVDVHLVTLASYFLDIIRTLKIVGCDIFTHFRRFEQVQFRFKERNGRILARVF